MLALLCNCWVLNAQRNASPLPKDSLIKQIKFRDPRSYGEQFLKKEQALIAAKDQPNLIELYFTHSNNLFNYAAYDSSLVIFQKIKALTSKKDPGIYGDLCVYLASTYYFKGNLDSFNYWHKEAIELSHENKNLSGDLFMLESFSSKHSGSYKQSVDCLLKAIKYYQSVGDEEDLAIAYQNLAVDYSHLGNFNAQKEYHLKAIEIFEKYGLDYHLIENYNALGSALKILGAPEEALRYYDLAYEKLEKAAYPALLAQNLTNRANILEKMGQYDKAERLFLQCREICEANSIAYGIILSDLNLGNLYRLKKAYSKSAQYLDQALQAALAQKRRREAALTYERLSWLERDKSNYKMAYEYQNKFHVLNDSLTSESIKKEVVELTEKYELEKKENAILALSKSQINMQYIIALLAFLLSILLILMQWLGIRSKLKEKERQKQEQQLRFELKMKEKELLAFSLNKISVVNTKESIAHEIKEIIRDFPIAQASKFKALLLDLSSDRNQSTLDEFEARFVGVYHSFFENLKAMAPGISPTELRIAAFIRLNLSTKEIASLTYRSAGTIDNIRSSIRKKLQLADDENLTDRLSEM